MLVGFLISSWITPYDLGRVDDDVVFEVVKTCHVQSIGA
jgi:hypothetical protein